MGDDSSQAGDGGTGESYKGGTDRTPTFRSECCCGWSYEDEDAALVLEAVETHRMEAQGDASETMHDVEPPERTTTDTDR